LEATINLATFGEFLVASISDFEKMWNIQVMLAAIFSDKPHYDTFFQNFHHLAYF